MVEEHFGEDGVVGEVGGALVAAERGEDAGAVGACGSEDRACHCCGTIVERISVTTIAYI